MCELLPVGLRRRYDNARKRKYFEFDISRPDLCWACVCCCCCCCQFFGIRCRSAYFFSSLLFVSVHTFRSFLLRIHLVSEQTAYHIITNLFVYKCQFTESYAITCNLSLIHFVRVNSPRGGGEGGCTFIRLQC